MAASQTQQRAKAIRTSSRQNLVANKTEPAKIQSWNAAPIQSRSSAVKKLAEYSRRLSLLSVSGVEKIYQDAHRDCAYTGKVLPPAASIQQLVASWKILRKVHRAG
jgi:hypothetical protein